MTPIITTMSAPAGRSRRVRGPVSSGGGGSGDELFVYGPGPNAPSWSGKTIYTDRKFTTPIPTASVDAAGFRGFNGFSTTSPLPDQIERIQYPTVDTGTALGTIPVLRMNFAGQTEFFTAAGQTTTPFGFRNGFNDYYRAAVYLRGTWTGEVAFEVSTDSGETWSSVSLPRIDLAGGEFNGHATGSSTTTTGLWFTPTTYSGTTNRIRARCVSLTSGTIEVRIGMKGGGAPADFAAGSFDAGHTRFYSKVILRRSAGFSQGNNSGTKGMFWQQQPDSPPTESTNHYFYQLMNGFGLQGNVFAEYLPFVNDPDPVVSGNFLMCEQLVSLGTSGGADGSVKMWVNNILMQDQSGLTLIPASKPAELTGIYVNPTFGGGQRPVPQNQYNEYAYFYRESAL